MALRFAFGEAVFIAVSVEIARRVGGVNFVNEVDGIASLAEFVLGIDQNQTAFSCDFGASFEELQGVFFQNGVVFR